MTDQLNTIAALGVFVVALMVCIALLIDVWIHRD